MHTHAQLRTRTCMRAMAAAKLTQVVSLVRRKLMHTPLAHTHTRTRAHSHTRCRSTPSACEPSSPTGLVVLDLR